MEFLHNVFTSCAESNNWDFAHYVFFTHWPTKAQSLEYYLSVSEDRVRRPKFWRARHRPLVCEGFAPERLGLLMRKPKFDLVKSILRDYYLADTSKDPDLLSLLNPYAVLYACMDLDLPLPPGFDLKFLWDHLSDLIDATRTADLVREDEIPGGPNALQLIPFQPPEPGLDDETIKALYAHYHLGKYPQTRLHVYIAASDMGTGGTFRADGAAEDHEFSLFRAASDTDVVQREVYALLDAAACWAHLWAGCTVRFHVASLRLAWAVNEFADFSEEFPALQVLQALAVRWGFELEACRVPADNVPLQARTARGLAAAGYTRFSRGGGLSYQIMDCILAQCHPKVGELGDDFLHVVLSLYTSLLREVKAPGYTYDMITPGRLYKQMRDQQRGDSSAVGPARNALSHRSGPYAHPKMPQTQWMQKSQTRYAAMSRHFSKWRPPLMDAPVVAVPFGGQAINLAPAYGSVTPEEYARVAFYFNQGDNSPEVAEEMEQRRLRAERRERNLRKAKGNEMRRMAALDDGHYEAKVPPKIHFWSPKSSSKRV